MKKLIRMKIDALKTTKSTNGTVTRYKNYMLDRLRTEGVKEIENWFNTNNFDKDMAKELYLE